MEQVIQKAIRAVEGHKDQLISVSDTIWGYAETKFEEWNSSKLLMDVLTQEGFSIEKNLAGIPTSFKGTYGSGYPVIGFLGEYDALPRLSQEAGCSFPKPREGNNSNGHGCGHHLLGTGLLGAALAVKEYLQESGRQGTVIYYGCPAEEGGSGKTWMVRENVFQEADALFSWHPFSVNRTNLNDILASIQMQYHFKGVAAHAAASPHLGRSALDAVELMNVGANYLREHIIQEARLHYAITDAGGNSANVVHPRATVLYQVRAPRISQVKDILERLNDIARGAALMTGTSVEIQFDRSCCDYRGNDTLNSMVYECFEKVGAPQPDESDMEFAGQLYETLDQQNRGECARDAAETYISEGRELEKQMEGKPLIDFLYPKTGIVRRYTASTDVGDVSQVKPVAFLDVACFIKDVSVHSWQCVAFGKSHFAHEGMLTAAKVLAAAAMRLYEEPEKLICAKEEFKRQEEKDPYICVVPKDAKPPIPARVFEEYAKRKDSEG